MEHAHYRHILDRDPTNADKKNYQTVYAEEQGSVAAPTAGMHFSEEVLKNWEKRSY